MDDAVEEGELGDLVVVGKGAQAEVYRTSFRLEPYPWELLYKKFLPKLAPRNPPVLGDLLRGYAAGDTEGLLDAGAWPLRLVRKQGRTTGFLMRAAPDGFFFEQPQRGGGSKRLLLEVQHLLNPVAYLARNDLNIGDRWRLEFLRDVAALLAELHARGIAVGDLSPKNLLASRTLRPRCFLLDADAATLHGRSYFDQAETPEWEAPDGEPRGTAATDAYKLALLAIRLFEGDQFSRSPAGLRRGGKPLVELAERALDAPASRPGPGEWLEPLASAARTASDAPLPYQAAVRTPRPGTGAGAAGARTPKAKPRARPLPTAPPTSSAPPTPPPAPRRRRVRLGRGRLAIAVALLGLLVYWNPTPLRPLSGPVHDQLGALVDGAQQSIEENRAGRQARTVQGLLDDSVASRKVVVNAVQDVLACSRGDSLSRPIRQLRQAFRSRQQAVTRAKALKVDHLPSGPKLRSALVRAFEMSAAADQAYVKWAKVRRDKHCSNQSLSSSHRRKGEARSKAAGRYKSTFIKLWTPIAEQHSLPVYTRKEL